MKGKKIKEAIMGPLMAGTSWMIPFVVAGGIYFSLSVMLNGTIFGTPAQPTTGFLGQLNQIGAAGLALFIPILGGYIGYAIEDKAALAPGMIGAYLAKEIGAGFIGGILAGFIAGYTIRFLKKTIKLPPAYRSLLTIFIYPLLGTIVAGGLMVFVIGQPIATLMEMMTNGLNSLSGAAKVPLGILLGSMVGVDMGGPINKVAYTFAQTQVDTLPYLMGGVGIAGAVPPLGIGLATILFKKKFSPEERDSGIAAILMGCMGITEGAIPYATADPIRVIPTYVIGSAVGCVSDFLFGCQNHAPWGGLIVLPVVDNRIGYVAGALIGAVVVAVLMRILKPDYVEPEKVEENLDDIEDIDLDIEIF